VGEAAGNRSPAPTVEELLAQMERQPLAAQGSTEPAAAAAAEEAAATEAQEEAPAEAGLVDIASILGAPTVTVVRSRL
jgi:predicted secreted protein